jgi:hypothetical protein
MSITDIEKRFLEVSGLDINLTIFPLPETSTDQIKTNKDKSKEFGEVFTPLWLVDKMILKAGIQKLQESKNTLDLCAGYGQFTIRMIRALKNNNKRFSCEKWLRENHTFIELQLESAYKILYIFGCDINLLIGDALQVKHIRQWKGVQIFKEGCWNKYVL